MKYPLVIFVCLYALHISAQEVLINYYDQDWKVCSKEVAQYYREYKTSNTGNIKGAIKDYYITGELQWIGKLKYIDSIDSHNDKRKTGSVKYYTKSGQVYIKGKYKDSLQQGQWKFYNSYGELVGIEQYVNGYKEGKQRRFIGGAIWEEISYVRDTINGPYKRYFSSDHKQIDREGIKINDREQGEWKFYHENGKLASKGVYKNGFKEGKWTCYYDNGQISAVGDFKKSQKEGEWQYFYPNGDKLPWFRYEDDPDQTGEWRYW